MIVWDLAVAKTGITLLPADMDAGADLPLEIVCSRLSQGVDVQGNRGADEDLT